MREREEEGKRAREGGGEREEDVRHHRESVGGDIEDRLGKCREAAIGRRELASTLSNQRSPATPSSS